MIRSKSVSIGNHSRARLVDSSRNRTFSRGHPNLMRSYAGLLEPRGSHLTPLKSKFNAEHFIRWLSWSILHGRSRSSMLVPPESSSAELVMIRSKSLPIYNRFHARWANSGKITISKGGTPLWCPRSRGISSPSGNKLPRKKLDTLGYHMVKTRGLYLTRHWIRTESWRTDRRTDRQNSHS